jgi:signal transduction histidine kinase
MLPGSSPLLITPEPGHALDQVLHHLSGNTGLYSQATFLNLFACFIRIMRENNLSGTVLTLTQGQPEFELAKLGLRPSDRIDHLDLDQRLSGDDKAQLHRIGSSGLGLLVVMTDRLSAFLHWNTQTEQTFRLLQGGWSFHPADTKTLALQLSNLLNSPVVTEGINKAPIDRRYDEKLTLIVGSLVNNLEARNRDLTLALSREHQLNHKMLENERLAAIGQLCSVIAHEIRNPLGLVDLYATLIEAQLSKTGQTDEQVSSHLNQIRQATAHLETVLSELTQYSRPLTLTIDPITVLAFVEEVCQFVLPSYQQKSVTLKVEASLSPDTPPQSPADRVRLRQSLLNLLKNALEATPEGTQVTVTVSHRQDDPFIFIKVKDQGTGISASNQQKLFTPYFSTKGSEGTGLGLAHVRKIMQAHGGNAQLLWSQPDQGSCFALMLPVSSSAGDNLTDDFIPDLAPMSSDTPVPEGFESLLAEAAQRHDSD